MCRAFLRRSSLRITLQSFYRFWDRFRFSNCPNVPAGHFLGVDRVLRLRLAPSPIVTFGRDALHSMPFDAAGNPVPHVLEAIADALLHVFTAAE
jgi:hypothetical protein